MGNKKRRLIILLVAIVVGVLAASVGVMAAFGVFKSDKVKAFELLMQAPQKLSQTSTGDYLGTGDMNKAMLERGMDVSMKVSHVKVNGEGEEEFASLLGKLQFDLGIQLDVKNQKGRMNLCAGAEESNISLQTYASLADTKVSIAAPELLANKVFTLAAKEDTKKDEVQKIQNFVEQFSKLKEDFNKYIEEQGNSVYEGIVCEAIKGGYRLTIPKDVTNDFLNSLSDFAEEKKESIEVLEELCKIEKGSIATELKKILPQLTADTTDFSFDVFGDRGILTGLKAVLKDKSLAEVIFTINFSEKENQFSRNLAFSVVQDGNTLAKAELKCNSVTGNTCKEDISCKATGENGVVLVDMQAIMEIEKATNAMKLTMSREIENSKMKMTANGSIKNLEKGKCVTFQYDDINVKNESLDGTQEYSLSAEITEGVLDGEVLALKGEEVAINDELINSFDEKYGQEMMLSFYTILAKWGVDPTTLLGSQDGEEESFGGAV